MSHLYNVHLILVQAATGVTVADEVMTEFNEFKLGRVKAKFIIYKIVDGKIITDTISESDNFDEFISLLPPDDCRYAVYDMEFSTTDGRPGNKIVMVAWYYLIQYHLFFFHLLVPDLDGLFVYLTYRAPDTAKIKSKMVYAGSKDALTRALVGVSTKVTATDMSELSKEILVEGKELNFFSKH